MNSHAPETNAPSAQGKKSFVGFGFGPIQTGLMLCEAVASGNFSQYTVSEVDARLVQAVRDNGDAVSINVARRDGVATVRLEGMRLLNPREPADRTAIVEAVRGCDEMATAIPSVSFYAAGGESSIAALIAEGAGPEKQRIVYTAENNNFAAEILREEVLKRAPAARLERVQFLNTVVGKMSGVISSPEEMKRLGLAPLVPGFDKCVLVEEFNRIYISKITLPGLLARHPGVRGERRPPALRGGQAVRPQCHPRPPGLPRRCPGPRGDERDQG